MDNFRKRDPLWTALRDFSQQVCFSFDGAGHLREIAPLESEPGTGQAGGKAGDTLRSPRFKGKCPVTSRSRGRVPKSFLFNGALDFSVLSGSYQPPLILPRKHKCEQAAPRVLRSGIPE